MSYKYICVCSLLYCTTLICPLHAAPPSSCSGLLVVEEKTRGTTITVRWERPEITGRDDFYYNIFYSEDNRTFTQHNDSPYNKQDILVDYSVSDLRPLTTYTVRVSPDNKVSGREGEGGGRSCEVTARTGDTSEWPDLFCYCTYSIQINSYKHITGTMQVLLHAVILAYFYSSQNSY